MSKHWILVLAAIILGGVIVYEWRKKVSSSHSTIASQSASLEAEDGFTSENQYSYD